MDANAAEYLVQFSTRVNSGRIALGENEHNVGIGTTEPTGKLHVVGNEFLDGDLLASGNIGIGTMMPPEKLLRR